MVLRSWFLFKIHTVMNLVPMTDSISLANPKTPYAVVTLSLTEAAHSLSLGRPEVNIVQRLLVHLSTHPPPSGVLRDYKKF